MKPPSILTVGCGLIAVNTFSYLCWHFIATYEQFGEVYSPLMRATFYIVIFVIISYILLKVHKGSRTNALLASIAAVSFPLAAVISKEPFVAVISGFSVLGVLLLWSSRARSYYVEVRRTSSVE